MSHAGTPDRREARVIALIKDLDTVELKLTLPETRHRSTVATLEMDPLDAQIRRVFFSEHLDADEQTTG